MSKKYKFKFKVGDIVRDIEDPDVCFKIESIDEEDGCYSAADCDKDGNLKGGSIDIWVDGDPSDSATEDMFEHVKR